ncbi:uncharacterized protein NPIL_47661 [Nephila pilipes]|uniref:Methyltransferase domain-containing protein n=1 Tax=Nephila pilipes TaxID=299642 RepID=A0A8X6TYJ0_NEPPI|nr:uncharacterized protein NPIL_47661 [Nephila pilipes]
MAGYTAIAEVQLMFKFFEDLIKYLMDSHFISPYQVHRAVERLLSINTHVRNNQTFQELDYNDIRNRIGYLRVLGPAHSFLVFEVMSKIFHDTTPTQIRKMLREPSLNVLFLGCGPGNDFFGFLSALYGRHLGIHLLNVTLMDKKRGWESVFTAIKNRLSGFGDRARAARVYSDVKIQTSFVEGNICEIERNVEITEIIRRMDLIFMVKIMPYLPVDEKETILRNLASSMKIGAILAVIDCPIPFECFSNLESILRPFYTCECNNVYYPFNSEFDCPHICKCSADVKLFVRM